MIYVEVYTKDSADRPYPNVKVHWIGDTDRKKYTDVLAWSCVAIFNYFALGILLSSFYEGLSANPFLYIVGFAIFFTVGGLQHLLIQ